MGNVVAQAVIPIATFVFTVVAAGLISGVIPVSGQAISLILVTFGKPVTLTAPLAVVIAGGAIVLASTIDQIGRINSRLGLTRKREYIPVWIDVSGALYQMTAIRGKSNWIENGPFCGKCRVFLTKTEGSKMLYSSGEPDVFHCDNLKCGATRFEEEYLSGRTRRIARATFEGKWNEIKLAGKKPVISDKGVLSGHKRLAS